MASRDHTSMLRDIARRAMLAQGFEPDLPLHAGAELARLGEPPLSALRDLRDLPWSSIDNDESLDLDQLEVCVPDGARTRLMVAIADVDALVSKDSAIDAHARTNTTSVYTPAEIFPMLPDQLSTDRTSLNQGADRAAVIVEMTIDGEGAVADSELYRAVVRNHAKLTYNGVAAWLDGATAAPAPLATADLAAQVRLQDELARALHARRHEEGALDFARTELTPVIENGMVRELRTEEPNRARDITTASACGWCTRIPNAVSSISSAPRRDPNRGPERRTRPPFAMICPCHSLNTSAATAASRSKRS